MATIKQKKALDKVVENGGNISKAMVDAGYSPETAHTPQKLTESKGWKELVEQYLPDSFVAQKHKELFTIKQVNYFVFPRKMDDEEIWEHVDAAGLEVITIRDSEKGKMAFYSVPDQNAIKSAVDLAYKIKGSYAPQKSEVHVEEKVFMNDEQYEQLLNTATKRTTDNQGS